MTDTNHPHAAEPTEGDGVQYSGIVWFLVVLVGTVVVSQVLVWGLFEFAESRVIRSDVARAPLAAAPSQPRLEGGRLLAGSEAPTPSSAVPKPGLLVNEAAVLGEYRKTEDAALATYGWVSKGDVVRLPIERAKDLVLERGLPVRQATPGPVAPAVPPTAR